MSHGHDDFAVEPIKGLPEELPDGEHILWQGAPDWKVLAVQAFHLRAMIIYFIVLMIWRGTSTYLDSGSALSGLSAAADLLPLAIVGAAVLTLMAFYAARTTVYTITNRRLVLRYGMALPMAINVPFSVVTSADLRVLGGSFGEIAVAIDKSSRIGYAHLWPHARPWRLRWPEPMLRALEDSADVAAKFDAAWKANTAHLTGAREAEVEQADLSADKGTERSPSAARPLEQAQGFSVSAA